MTTREDILKALKTLSNDEITELIDDSFEELLERHIQDSKTLLETYAAENITDEFGEIKVESIEVDGFENFLRHGSRDEEKSEIDFKILFAIGSGTFGPLSQSTIEISIHDLYEYDGPNKVSTISITIVPRGKEKKEFYVEGENSRWYEQELDELHEVCDDQNFRDLIQSCFDMLINNMDELGL